MNQFWITFSGINFIFIMTTLGAALVFFLKKELSDKLNAAFFGLASGIMLAAAVWSLLLPALDQAGKTWGRYAFAPVLIGFLFGGAILTLAELLFKNLDASQQKKDVVLSWKLFMAVTLHNIPEGLAVGFAFGLAATLGTTAAYISALGLAIGIGVQNFPEGVAVALPLRKTTNSRIKAFIYGGASGIVEPIFAVIGYVFSMALTALQPWLLAISAGTIRKTESVSST
jgi:ZIP family zinc transporter